MKQAIKKVDAVKASPAQATHETKSLKSNQADEPRLTDLSKTNLFNRFLESSCDCV
jgi:hypothetical protein